MTTNDVSALVLRMQECFTPREFDRADDLIAPDFVNHTLGTTGFESGKNAWRSIVA